MNTEIADMAMTTLVAMSQTPEKFSAVEIKNFYENIIAKLPCFVFWKDKDFKYVFCNEVTALDLLKLSSPSEIVGKTDFDFGLEFEAAKWVRQTDEKIIETGKPLLNIEMAARMSDERIVYLSVNRMPLFNSANEVIGIIGISVDITAQKETEILKLDNERQKTITKEQEKFAQLARKVAHDINSPLAALKMMLDRCDELPEKKRSILQRATESILDIANNLINSYQVGENSATSAVEVRQPFLVSDQLIQLLSEKKVQYQQRPISFETVIAEDAHYAFILMQKTEFRRSMSNLINNAVDALENQHAGVVTIQLTADADSVVVKIQDNGKGISRDKVEKMLERQGFTEGKKDGHGLGLQQVWDTLEYNQGTMAVQSELGKGTSIQLTFPRVATSEWIAQKIYLATNAIILILDDDPSIHTAWNLRFSSFLSAYPTLVLCHFTQGQEVLDYLDKLNPSEKERVLFLSDYELLHQNRNGLQIIHASQLKEAVLVTSYYANPTIRDAAAKLNVKILPKQMASVIPIDMNIDFEANSAVS